MRRWVLVCYLVMRDVEVEIFNIASTCFEDTGDDL